MAVGRGRLVEFDQMRWIWFIDHEGTGLRLPFHLEDTRNGFIRGNWNGGKTDALFGLPVVYQVVEKWEDKGTHWLVTPVGAQGVNIDHEAPISDSEYRR